jgi:hypothetical protein
MVVDFDGRILAQADPGPGEKVVVAPINIDTLRFERTRRKGHDMRAHLRSGIHSYLSHNYLDAGNRDLSIDSNNQRIADAKERLR